MDAIQLACPVALSHGRLSVFVPFAAMTKAAVAAAENWLKTEQSQVKSRLTSVSCRGKNYTAMPLICQLKNDTIICSSTVERISERLSMLF